MALLGLHIYGSTNQRIIYRDGFHLAEDTATGDFVGSGAFSLGKIGWSEDAYFGGEVDEVAIYNEVMLPETVLAHYQNAYHYCGVAITPTPPSCPEGMIAYWPAEGDATDYMGDHDGTMMNGAAFASGKIAQSFSLDGDEDRKSVV